MTAAGSPREEAENYRAVVCHLTPALRVIVCVNGIQWIVQRRRGAVWRSIAFCATRRGLERVCAALGAPLEPLRSFPEHIRAVAPESLKAGFRCEIGETPRDQRLIDNQDIQAAFP